MRMFVDLTWLLIVQRPEGRHQSCKSQSSSHFHSIGAILQIALLCCSGSIKNCDALHFSPLSGSRISRPPVGDKKVVMKSPGHLPPLLFGMAVGEFYSPPSRVFQRSDNPGSSPISEQLSRHFGRRQHEQDRHQARNGSIGQISGCRMVHQPFMPRRKESHSGNAGVRGYYFPAVVKLLDVHNAVFHHRLLGTWERDRPPSES
jgi:hypothetical protein